MTPSFPRKIMVTGAGGNLGSKIVEALLRTSWCEGVIGVDLTDDDSKFSASSRGRLRLIKGDLTKREGEWTKAIDGVDAVIHFAAANPVPDSSWQEALASHTMTMNLVLECVRAGVGRFVFASSNHAMGAYKDPPLADRMGPGRLTTDIAPAPGTRWFDGTRELHSLAYGTSKVMSEEFLAAATELATGRLSTVSVRVGWNLAGENHASGITHSGSPASVADTSSLDDDAKRVLRWFRNMWLSNRDLEQIFIASVLASDAAWPSRSIIVNGVSNNRDMDWSLATARDYLAYEPQDDAFASLAAADASASNPTSA